MALLVMEMTAPSHKVITVASEAHLDEEAAIFIVTAENL